MRRSVFLLAPVAGLLFGACAGGSGPASPTPQDDGTKSVAELTKTSRRLDGLFTLYEDTVSGQLRMLVRPDQVGREYVYFAHTVDGVVDVGQFRGAFLDNKVVAVERSHDHLMLVTRPTQFWFDSTNALSRAAMANVSPAVLVSAEIVAKDSATGAMLIDADPIFRTEALVQVKPSPDPDAGPRAFALGGLSEDKTRVAELHDYPLNTDVVVDYVYDNGAPMSGGSDGVTDPRAVTIRIQHTLIAMPENDFRPRFEDPRVGYFTERQTDMTSTSATPYRDVIDRWYLRKQDPSAALSEPVEPIVFWIENTTPVEFRPTIRDAVLEWNKAFERAGFRNAIVVRQQPDDADWDAGDIRYNVLRWTSSPNPPFGGYGPSFTNPRTGQILGADIMLEFVYVTNRVRYDRLFTEAAMGSIEPADLPETPDRLSALCSFGPHLQESALLGLYTLRMAGAPEVAMTDFVNQALRELVMHEVGHTLGLNHNMKASQARSFEAMRDAGLTRREGLYGSVMDYADIVLASPGERQGEYFMTTVGPYDRWAIEFGYSPALEQPEAEAARLERILARSTEPELAFGNDADDMRSPGKAIDPRVNVDDMSSDAIGYAIHKAQLVRELMPELMSKFSEPGASWHELRNAYLVLTGHQARAGSVLSRYVGGVYVDRAMQGQQGSTQPFTPVPLADQKRAMRGLATYLFAPDAFDAPQALLDHLAMQRRGFDFFSATEDPKLHERALGMQSAVLDHLLHPVTLQRITDSRLYGNAYSVSDMMGDLTDAIFAADARSSVNTFRQDLQIEYVGRLASMIDEDDDAGSYDAVARSAALANLRSIDRLLAGKGGDAETRAHTEHVRFLIAKALDTSR